MIYVHQIVYFRGGTFKSSLAPFTRFYTVYIQSSTLNRTVPMLYSLLPNKTKNMNKFLFTELRTITVKHNLGINPRYITLDFEQGAISTLKHIFLSAILKGFNCHYRQSLFRKVEALGLQKDHYDSLPDDPTSIENLFKQPTAMVFMPI